MQEVQITWKVALLTIWSHALVSCRVTAILVSLLWFIGWCILKYMGTDFSNIDWTIYQTPISLGLMFIHFFPVNIYAVRKLANKHFGGGYRLKIVKES